MGLGCHSSDGTRTASGDRPGRNMIVLELLVSDTNNCRGGYDLHIKLYQIVWWCCSINDGPKLCSSVICHCVCLKSIWVCLRKRCPKISWLIMIFLMKTSINLGLSIFFGTIPYQIVYYTSRSILCVYVYIYSVNPGLINPGWLIVVVPQIVIATEMVPPQLNIIKQPFGVY